MIPVFWSFQSVLSSCKVLSRIPFFLITYLRYNLYTRKFILFKYIVLFFDKHRRLCDHHHTENKEYFLSQNVPCLFYNQFPPQPLATAYLSSVPFSIMLLYKHNCIICSLLHLFLPIIMLFRFIYVISCIMNSFLLCFF